MMACSLSAVLLLGAMVQPQLAMESMALKETVTTKQKALVIAHRGASALRPEHTLAAYGKAIEDGADFIEPDLVMTRDGVPIARHENELSDTTDVAAHAEFAARKTTRSIDGEEITGWFSEDFTLAEIRQLRARERLPQLRGSAHDGRHSIPTFVEIADFVARQSKRQGRLIGVIPELKHSSYFRSIGLDLDRAAARIILRHPYLHRAPVGVQSFEVDNLKQFRKLLGERNRNVFLVQLIDTPESVPYDRVLAGDTQHDYASMTTPAGLARIATYADVVAPNIRRVIPLDAISGDLAAPTSLVADAHAVGLKVHVWTLRPENHFLPPALRCSDKPEERCERGALIEIRAFLGAGVDAFFTDDPAIGRRAVDSVPAG